MTADNRDPKRFGCLKVLMFGCLGVVVLVLVAGIVFWWALTRWDRTQTAWPHMPPSTVMALEGHGINGLLKRVSDDPGILAVLGGLARRFDKEGTFLSGTEFGSHDDLVRAMREYYRQAGFLYDAVAPNIAMVGITGKGEAFAIIQRPAWLRWAGDFPDASSGRMRREYFAGGDAFIVVMDDWLVAAHSQETMQEIIDNWKAGANPLGPSPRRGDSSLAFAYRSGSESGTAEEAPPAGPGSLMLGDPFADPGDAGNAPSAPGFAIRGVLAPDSAGWSVAGEFSGTGNPGVDGSPDAGGSSGLSLPEGHAVALAVRLPIDAQREMRDRLSRRAQSATAPDRPPVERLFWTWLWHSWLSRASGDFVTFADEPAVKTRDPVPPLPVLCLGWTYPRDINGPRAVAEFNQSLALLLDASTSPGGNPFVQTLKDSVSYSIDNRGTGWEGVIHVPPVLANAVAPAWRFPDGQSPIAGWLASDPAGLTAADDPGVWKGFSGRGSALLRWNTSYGFRDAALAAIRDRLETIPDETLPGRKKILQSCEIADMVLGAYPIGSVEAWKREEDGNIVFRVFIPYGRGETGILSITGGEDFAEGKKELPPKRE